MDSLFQSVTDLVEKNAPVLFKNRKHVGVIAGSIALVSLYSLYQRLRAVKDGTPMVPSTSLLYGSTREFEKDPEGFLRKYSELYGPVFRARLNGSVQTVIGGTYVREVFFNTDFDLMHFLEKRFNLRLIVGIDDGVFSNEQMRKLVVHFTTQLKAYTPRAVQYLDLGRKEFLSAFPTDPIHLPHLYPLVIEMVSKASASVFAGIRLANDPSVVESFKNITIEVGSEINVNNIFFETFSSLNYLRMFVMGKFSKTLAKHKKILFAAVYPEVERRIKGAKTPGWEKPDDVLQLILEMYFDGRGDVNTVSDAITKWLIGLIFAAIHTTSENTSIVLYRLIEHPDVIEELLEEQREVVKRHGLDPDEKDPTKMFTSEVIKDLKKLDSACREALRLRNDMLNLGHTYLGKQKITLSNGTVIRPGEDVILNIWYNQRTAAVQPDKHDDYSVYKPFRYVDANRPASKVGDDYLLFGEGKHACPGRWFALQEMKTIISFLIRDYKLTPEGPIVHPTSAQLLMPYGQVLMEKKK
ncbi:cytochrome P450 [Dichotomocladium elegans]|nr:cytochrome P450 [Dichotomocladium elegans]